MATQRRSHPGCAALGAVLVQGACIIAGRPRGTRWTLCACPVTDPYRGLRENEYLGVPLKRYTFVPVWQVCRGRLVAQVCFLAPNFSITENQGLCYWHSGHGPIALPLLTFM